MKRMEAMKKLGLPSNFNEKILKKAYRTLVKQYHPDVLAKLPSDKSKEGEKEFKEITEAYDTLLEAIKGGMEKDVNNWNNFYSDNVWDQMKESTAERGEIETCYSVYFGPTIFANTPQEKKKKMKIFLRSRMPEKLYVKLCIQAEKKELNQLCHLISRMQRSLSYNYTNGADAFPIQTATLKRMLRQITDLCDVGQYNYELLSKIDEIVKKAIDDLHREYRESKFNKESALGYENLISIYDTEWSERKEMIHELAYDCNFSDLYSEFLCITSLVDNKLEKLLEKEVSECSKKYDKVTKEIIEANQEFRDKLYCVYWEGEKFLNREEFYFLFNKASYNNTYIDKEIIEENLDKAILFFSNRFENIKLEEEKIHWLSCIDKQLDTFPKIRDYFPLSEILTSPFTMLNNDEFIKKQFKNLFQEGNTENPFPYNEIEHYIAYPDFTPEYFNQSATDNKYSILNCVLTADYYEKYVQIDSKTLKRLYNTPYLSASTKSSLGGSLFLETRYNKGNYFLAFRTSKIVFDKKSRQYRVKLPEIVKINRTTYQAILEKYVTYFRTTELKEPGSMEKIFSEIAMSMTSDLEQNNQYIDISSMSLQEIMKLRDELKSKLLNQKIGWIMNLEQFSMSMNNAQWVDYSNQMIDRFQIDLFPFVDTSGRGNTYVEFWESLIVDSLKAGVCCFDNRKTFIKDDGIIPLTEQRKLFPADTKKLHEDDIRYSSQYQKRYI